MHHLTTFELNSNSITQRWIENEFYSLDEKRIMSFRNRLKENARFSISRTRINILETKSYHQQKGKLDASIVIDIIILIIIAKIRYKRDLHPCQNR